MATSSREAGEFAGKVVIVTGAASGLGREAALAFARTGATLAIADIEAAGLEETAEHVRQIGAEVITIAADLGDTALCANVVERTVQAFGRIDALCNIAGVIRFNMVANITPEDWDLVFGINVRAPFFLIQSALPHLIASEGAIVNVASASAFIGHAYLCPYAASKAALVNLTKSLAMEYVNSAVRINALAPGAMITPMVTGAQLPEGIDYSLVARYAGLRPAGGPEDVIDLLLFLASSRGKAVHGACLVADRGITAG